MEPTTINSKLTLEAAPILKNVHSTGKRSLKNDKSNNNPTIANLRKVGANCKKGLMTSGNRRYEPTCVKGVETKTKEAFKESCVFVCNDNQYEIIATDDPTTITGNLSKLILKSKRGQDWTLTDSLVSICKRELGGSEDKEVKCFNLDIPAFLHFFASPEYLHNLILEMSTNLSESWTAANGPREMSGKRTSNELPLIFDFRKSPWGKGTTELALAATTFNHSLATQAIDEDVVCEPHNVYLQMRYQSDNKPKKGMLVLPRNEWIHLINNQIFQKFYAKVWDYLPLTDDYNERILKHLTADPAFFQDSSKPLVYHTILAPNTPANEDIDEIEVDSVVTSKKNKIEEKHEE